MRWLAWGKDPEHQREAGALKRVHDACRPGGETRGGFLPRACSSRSARSYSAEASAYWPLRKLWLPAARSSSTESESLGAIPGDRQTGTTSVPRRVVRNSFRPEAEAACP